MASEREETQRRRRALHERLRALTYEPLMRGSIVERRRKCGKPNCACATNPDARHGGKVLAVFLDGRTQMLPLRQETVRLTNDRFSMLRAGSQTQTQTQTRTQTQHRV